MKQRFYYCSSHCYRLQTLWNLTFLSAASINCTQCREYSYTSSSFGRQHSDIKQPLKVNSQHATKLDTRTLASCLNEFSATTRFFTSTSLASSYIESMPVIRVTGHEVFSIQNQKVLVRTLLSGTCLSPTLT